MVGDLYKLKLSCLDNFKGTIGVVFNDYGDGEQLIFPNGNYDGFSNEEKKDFLEYVGHDTKTENYKFKNVITVSNDFRWGLWEHIFSK